MEWINNLNRAMNYIEEHITEKIDYEELARESGCSAYHFQKMFYYMTDLSLTEYIRRRKMSLAAEELREGREKVIDIAMKYGYSSPTAFNRAFQSVHGAPPSAVKKGLADLKTYPMLRFSLAVYGKEKLSFRIEEKEAFCVLGISCPLSKKLEENFCRIPQRWDRALADGTLKRLAALSDGQPSGFLGVSVHHIEEWKYLIAVSSSHRDSSFESCEIPEAVWAVFSGRGTNVSLQELERRVITEWLPASGYACADIPDIEVYIKADPKDAVYEYWLPVIRKQEEGKR